MLKATGVLQIWVKDKMVREEKLLELIKEAL